MEKQELDTKIQEIAKTLLSYCTARTSSQFEAEDLAQEITLEIYQSAENIQKPEAIYGFLWGVAGNVYKQWCKNKAREKMFMLTDQFQNLTDGTNTASRNYPTDNAAISNRLDPIDNAGWTNQMDSTVRGDPTSVTEPPDEEDSALYLLRRELTLLSSKYRKAVILYYIDGKSCSEISALLKVSESMVKYLLFKSRQILKEGMNMERNYGQQSYNPKGLSLLFWGNGSNRYAHLCDSKISQNILFACYNDRLSAEQISLEIGVSLPYMEDKLAELCEYDLLKKEGNRYYTNIVIFTKDFIKEVNDKTAGLQERIADLLTEAIFAHEEDVRKIGFYGSDMGNLTFTWQMAGFILYRAVIEILQNKIGFVYPKDKFGTECLIWGVEVGDWNLWKYKFMFGISNVVNNAGDYVQFMDFPINGEMVHHCFNWQNTNVFLDIARGGTEHLSENDKAIAADMVRKGYVVSDNGTLTVNAPVFTKGQHDALKSVFADTALQIAEEAEKLMDVVTRILKNHIPAHLKKLAKDMAYLRLFEDAISAPVSVLYERQYLLPYSGNGMLPTTYIILNQP